MTTLIRESKRAKANVKCNGCNTKINRNQIYLQQTSEEETLSLCKNCQTAYDTFKGDTPYFKEGELEQLHHVVVMYE